MRRPERLQNAIPVGVVREHQHGPWSDIGEVIKDSEAVCIGELEINTRSSGMLERQASAAEAAVSALATTVTPASWQATSIRFRTVR